MHSSMMHTASFNGHIYGGGCLPRDAVCLGGGEVSAQGWVSARGVSACLPGGGRCVCPEGVCRGARGNTPMDPEADTHILVHCILEYTPLCPLHAGIHPPPCGQFLTDACENINFPQLLLQTVITDRTCVTVLAYVMSDSKFCFLQIIEYDIPSCMAELAYNYEQL